MTPEVFAIVFASAACKHLLGTSPMRFYEHGEAPQGVAKPYAVWQMPTSVPANYLGNLPDADDSRVQIDIYADTSISAKQTSIAIRDALEQHVHMLLAASRGRDPETRVFGFLLEFQFITDR